MSTLNEQQLLEIAAPWQPDIKAHLINVERAIQRIIRDGGQPADVAKRLCEMFDSIHPKLFKKAEQRANERRADGELKLLKIDCKAGCAYCCCVPVTVFPFEVDLLARELKAKLKPEEIESLKIRIQGVIDEREKGKRPRCALLGPDNLCSVYEVRPLHCRSCNSPNVNECISYEDTGDETPREMFIIPSVFVDQMHCAANFTLDPDLTPQNYPAGRDLMDSLLKAL